MTDGADLTAVTNAFIHGLHDAGVRHIVASPGSRSTPLVIAASRHAEVEVTMIIDERTAGFVALGIGLASGEPVAVLCSSGTAGANYLPALSEASLADVAVIAITADRPPEHQFWGVGQTFDQTGLFHRQVRQEFVMPTGAAGGPAHALRAGQRAGYVAQRQHGPVHVNWPFRLPLEPVPTEVPGNPVVHQRQSQVPVSVAPRLIPGQADALAALVEMSSQPVLVAGPYSLDRRRNCDEQANRIVSAAKQMGIPIIADVLSGLRGLDAPLIDGAQFLAKQGQMTSDLVIRVGDTPTDKNIRLWWESLPHAQHILIDPRDRWQDPSHLHTQRFTSDPDLLFERVARIGAGPRSAWMEHLVAMGEAMRDRIEEALATAPHSEGHLASDLLQSLPDGALLVASSSMPIRDLDTFGGSSIARQVICNRGVNGIDGVIGTAMGVALASPSRSVVVYIGDIAAQHDIGSLFQAARSGIALTILLANNDGGAIFSMLPAAEVLDAQEFTSLFTTPHGTDFSFVGGHDGVDYATVDGSLESTIPAKGSAGSVHVLEARVDANARFELLRSLATSPT